MRNFKPSYPAFQIMGAYLTWIIIISEIIQVMMQNKVMLV